MNGDFMDALRQLEREKEIPMASLIETVEQALASAYKKHTKTSGHIRVQIEPAKGIAFKVIREIRVVEAEPEEVGDVTLEEARQTRPEAQVGDVFIDEVKAADFGRIAAQTAKQVVVQRIREVERDRIYNDFLQREDEVVTAVVQRREQKSIIVNIGRTEALLPASEQVRGEPYHFGDRVKVYVLEVRKTAKGPQVIVSRTHPTLIRRLFELEVPEIEDGTVVIKSVAREPGARTKIAVATSDDKVDPVGACVGHRGGRVQAVVNELYGEKIDIVRWREYLDKFVEEALSPAKVSKIQLTEVEKGLMAAKVIVAHDQLSLAIGKGGQNVRLAARLTDTRIDIIDEDKLAEEAAAEAAEEAAFEALSMGEAAAGGTSEAETEEVNAGEAEPEVTEPETVSAEAPLAESVEDPTPEEDAEVAHDEEDVAA